MLAAVNQVKNHLHNSSHNKLHGKQGEREENVYVCVHDLAFEMRGRGIKCKPCTQQKIPRTSRQEKKMSTSSFQA